jgi:exosome complex component MTR3
VHGPRSLPRSMPFSPHIVLSANVKYAPFATRQRRGYLGDSTERDLGVHLETALRGAIIANRWPKSGVDITVTIIEGDQDHESAQAQGEEIWEHMIVLSGCVTVASAALIDAGIDCVDTVAGGVAAVVPQTDSGSDTKTMVVLDPVPGEHASILAACCVANLPSRGELTNVWLRGDLPADDGTTYTALINSAVQASRSANSVLVDSLKESVRQARRTAS